MSYIIISAPVYQREWILPTWFAYIESQDWPLADLGFVFELAPNDDATLGCLIDFHERHPEVRHFDLHVNHQVPHKTHPEGTRSWTKDHYIHMATMRNNILDRVTQLKPDRLFSLDTDVLLEDPRTISKLFELTHTLQAVNPLLYMTPINIDFPSVMTWVADGRAFRDHSRYPLGEVFQADVIMAAVMMTPVVYRNVRYAWHKQGEDLGWSRDAANKGIKLYCASNLYSPHIMSRQMLEEYLERGDPRKLMYLEKVAHRLGIYP
jgi:hypothetical protein